MKPMTAIELFGEVEEQFKLIHSTLDKKSKAATTDEKKTLEGVLERQMKSLRLDVGNLLSLYAEMMKYYHDDYMSRIGSPDELREALDQRVNKIVDATAALQNVADGLGL